MTRIAHRPDVLAALLGFVLSVAAVCPCAPSHPASLNDRDAQEHACCAPAATPTLAAADSSCCFDEGLTETPAATPSVADSPATGPVAGLVRPPVRARLGGRACAPVASSPPAVLRI